MWRFMKALLRNSWERGRLGRKKSRPDSGAPVSSLRTGSTIGGLDAERAKQPAPPVQGLCVMRTGTPGLRMLRILQPGLHCRTLSGFHLKFSFKCYSIPIRIYLGCGYAARYGSAVRSYPMLAMPCSSSA
jgi:hypothetical protein